VVPRQRNMTETGMPRQQQDQILGRRQGHEAEELGQRPVIQRRPAVVERHQISVRRHRSRRRHAQTVSIAQKMINQCRSVMVPLHMTAPMVK